MQTKVLQEGEKVAKDSIIKLFILGVLKIIAGVMTGMTVVLADGLSTFADTLGLFASYFGLRLSRKSSDKKFSYGYYKIETFAAFIVSVSIIYLGYVIAKKSFETLISPTQGDHLPFAITITVISIAFSARLAKKLAVIGEKVNSLSLKANARDKKMDVFSGIAVLASILANYQGIPYVEGIISLVIAFFILKEGVSSSRESLFFLLDYWDDPSLTKKIRKTIKKQKGIITEVKNIKLRRAGTFVFGEALVEINPFAGLQDLREELKILQNKIQELNPYIRKFSIYNNISKPKSIKVAVPVKEGTGLKGKIATSLADTKKYLFANLYNGKIKDSYIKNISEEEKKPVELATFLKKEKVEILIDNDLNSLTYYNLRRTHHILIYPNFSDLKKVKETLDLLLIDT